MREKEGISFENVHLFPMYEFVPLPNKDTGVLAQIKEHFATHVGIPDEHLHGLDSQLSKEDVGRAIEEFDDCIHQLGGIDLLITGLGRRGSVGVNSPGSIWSQGTHLSVLDSTSVQEAISTFNTKENVPPTAVTIGLKNLSEARKIILLAWGEAKAEVIANVEGTGGAIDRHNEWQVAALGRDINPDQLRKRILSPSWGENLTGAFRADVVKPTYKALDDTQVAKFSGHLTVSHKVESEVV